MPSSQSCLDILNADQFDIGFRLSTSGRRSSTETGQKDGVEAILSARESIEAVSATPRSPAAKPVAKRSLKRVRTSVADAEEDQEQKRARGRPRVDANDVTAADRRRTQIRLAQRAYRNRKERAIHLLEKKVKSLRDANEAMGNAFMRLNDNAISFGLVEKYPQFARLLHSTMETFLDLARQSSADDEDDNDEDEADSSGKEPAQQIISASAKAFGYHARDESSSPESIAPLSQQAPGSVGIHTYGGYIVSTTGFSDTRMVPNSPTNSGGYLGLPTTGQSTSSSPLSMSPGVDYLYNNEQFSFSEPGLSFFSFPGQVSSSNVQTANILNNFASPYGGLAPKSFSPLATTFGRRLMRITLERAYQLLTSPNPPPDMFARAFGICIMFESLDKIRSRVRAGLVEVTDARALMPDTFSRNTKERDCLPNFDVQSKQSLSDAWLSPAIPGFEKAFYDCDGTEFYLRQRGVDIPPGSDRVVVEVDTDDFGGVGNRNIGNPDIDFGAFEPASHSSSSPDTSTFSWDATSLGASSSGSTAQPSSDALSSFLFAEDRALDPSQQPMVDLRSYMAAVPEPLQKQPRGTRNSSSPSRRQLFALDVERFLKELSSRSTCVGQSPGYRPSDVNEAFWNAVRSVPAAS